MNRAILVGRLGVREHLRRPLLAVLIVVVPVVLISRSIAQTEPLPRTIPLPGGGSVATTMREIHGASMAAIAISFLAGLLGVFMMGTVRQADRRLAIAGYRPVEVAAPRLVVLSIAVIVVIVASIGVTALSFAPRQWFPFLVGTTMVALIYACLGAMAGAVLDRLSAVYLLLFVPMLDLGVVQNPMFGSGEPPTWGVLLPAFGPGRVIVDGAFSDGFDAWVGLLAGTAWIGALLVAVILCLQGTIRTTT